MLTIGMATYRDSKALWHTLQVLHANAIAEGVRDQVEFVVVDNDPAGPHGKVNAKYTQNVRGRYVALPEPIGTAPPRQRVFDEARGDWVLVVDAHVHLQPGRVRQLVEWTTDNTSPDLYQGVLLNSEQRYPVADFERYVRSLKLDPTQISGELRAKIRRGFETDRPYIQWTHWAGRWGEDGLFGKAAVNPAAVDPLCEPFQIPYGGLWCFLSRRETWLGFHTEFRQFGIEGYIQTKYRRANRGVWCLPWLRGTHWFRDAKAYPPEFPMSWINRTRNYVLAWQDVRMRPLHEVYQHHVKHPGRTTEQQWQAILSELGIDPKEAADPATQPAPVQIGGPGTELKALIASLGIQPKPNCGCNRLAAEMDAWGVAGCRTRHHEICGRIKDNAAEWGWSLALSVPKAAAKALTTGLVFSINPLDPIGSLVTEAIRRAEIQERNAA